MYCVYGNSGWYIHGGPLIRMRSAIGNLAVQLDCRAALLRHVTRSAYSPSARPRMYNEGASDRASAASEVGDSRCCSECCERAWLCQPKTDVVEAFVKGRDVFAVLPTGYGKSLCIGCLLLVFDKLLGKEL